MTSASFFPNANLAGILSEALGLESGDGRSHFSGASRKALQMALDHESAPETFEELGRTLRQLDGDEETLAAVTKMAQQEPGRSLQEYAKAYTAGPA